MKTFALRTMIKCLSQPTPPAARGRFPQIVQPSMLQAPSCIGEDRYGYESPFPNRHAVYSLAGKSKRKCIAVFEADLRHAKLKELSWVITYFKRGHAKRYVGYDLRTQVNGPDVIARFSPNRLPSKKDACAAPPGVIQNSHAPTRARGRIKAPSQVVEEGVRAQCAKQRLLT